MEQSERIAILLYKYVTKSISDEESKSLFKWVDAKKSNADFFRMVTDRNYLQKEFISYQALKDRASSMHLPDRLRPGFVSNKFMYWRAAATVAIGILLVTVMLLFFSKQASFAVWDNTSDSETAKGDVSPGRDHAILILSNGRSVQLDSVSGIDIPPQGNSELNVNKDGELQYSAVHISSSGVSTGENHIRTPRGGFYRVLLPDGTRVWLNSDSELRFSPAFFQKKRIVMISGEAYFEVRKKQQSTFTVLAGNTNIEVLGTSFNVSAYANEEVKTTLVEGKIRLSNQSDLVHLDPGDEAIVQSNGLVEFDKEVNVKKSIAWKEGKFSFDRDDLQTVMKQVGRWYNVTTIFRDTIPGHFVATIDRNVPLSQVLRLLELAGGVQFEIREKTVIVRKTT